MFCRQLNLFNKKEFKIPKKFPYISYWFSTKMYILHLVVNKDK